MPDDALATLAADLGRARDRARGAAGASVTGVRAVELADGRRHYLCAFDDGRVRFLDAVCAPVADDEVCRTIAGAALTVEYIDELIDPAECAVVVSLAARAAEMVDDPDVRSALDEVSDATARLTAWRSDPMRAVAALTDLDDGAALQAPAHAAHQRFVAATEPLVAIQSTLDPEFVRTLGELENACVRAGIAGSLAEAVGSAMEAIVIGAQELVGLNAD